MKWKRHLACLLAVAVVVSMLTGVAVAQPSQVPGLGVLYREHRLPLGDNTQLVQTTLAHELSGLQEERYIEWGPDSQIQAIVASSSALYGGAFTLNTLLQRMQSQGKEVVAALNGDFFTVSTGVPLGIVITDGIIRASDNYQWAVGFPAAGGAFISKSPMSIVMTAALPEGNKTVSIDVINHTRVYNRLSLFTPDFGASTQTSTAGTHVVLNTSDALTVGGSVTGTVDRVVTGKSAVKLQQGQMVLSVDDKGPKSRLDGLAAGVTVTIQVNCSDARFSDAAYAVGAYQKLLTNGLLPAGLEKGTAPRTAVGVKADGSAVFYTVDGRQSGYSVGLTLTDVAKRMQAMGCVEAVNLDGGGSTILGARYPGQSAVTVTNRPSDGSQRKVADYIVLVNNTPRLDTVDQLFVYPAEPTLLVGATLSMSATAADQNYHNVPVPAVTWWSDNLFVGEPDASGLFTAAAAGECEVAVTGSGVTGGTVVRVVDKLDAIKIVGEKSGSSLSSLALSPDETVNLTAAGTFEKRKVVSQDICYTWSVTGNIGNIDEKGTFTAASLMGVSGTIVVEHNGVSASIPVTVGKVPVAVEDFETGGKTFGTTEKPISFALETDAENAVYGLRAGAVKYNFTDLPKTETTLSLPVDIALPAKPSHLNLWVGGDKSGNQLLLAVANGTKTTMVPVATLDFSGYKYVSLELPSGATKISALCVEKADKGAKSGRLLLDQLVVAYQAYDDTTPPTAVFDLIDDTSEPGYVQVSAHVVDDTGALLKAGRVSLRWDGAPTKYTYSEASGILTAKIPFDAEQLHRLTLEAVDPAGNRVRISEDLWAQVGDSSVTTHYTDVESSHWGIGYIAFLDNLGVVLGHNLDKPDLFTPDAALTRADMAIYVSRMRKTDLSLYDDVKLPFTDIKKIPEHALREVRALYALGMIKGKNKGGKLYFDPTASITRAEFCTLLGRTLPRGFTKSTPDFADKGKIPAYAKDHISTMLALGFIGGYTDNTMRSANSISRAEASKVLYMFH